VHRRLLSFEFFLGQADFLGGSAVLSLWDFVLNFGLLKSVFELRAQVCHRFNLILIVS
jgi:hypothetical protein